LLSTVYNSDGLYVPEDRTVPAVSTEYNDWLDLFSGGGDKTVVLPILSGSMAGTLLPGDILLVRPLGGKKAHTGDIVVFRDGGKLVAHRLIFVFRLFSFAFLVEKGDANRTATIIDPKSIVGRVEAAHRNEKLILDMTEETRRTARRLAAKSFRRVSFETLKDITKRTLRCNV
jgi:signal peptidase I